MNAQDERLCGTATGTSWEYDSTSEDPAQEKIVIGSEQVATNAQDERLCGTATGTSWEYDSTSEDPAQEKKKPR